MTTTLKVVAVVTGAAFAGVLAFIIFGATVASHLNAEVFKTTYQFLLLSGIGGAITFLYKELENERRAFSAEARRKREIHDELITAYHATKAIRRRLRARAVILNAGGEELVDKAIYDAEMQRLIETQLIFEKFKRRAERSLWPELRSAEEPLKAVESYIGHTISEYEKELRRLRPAQTKLSNLPVLEGFIDKANVPDGFEVVASAFDVVLKELDGLGTELVNVTSNGAGSRPQQEPLMTRLMSFVPSWLKPRDRQSTDGASPATANAELASGTEHAP